MADARREPRFEVRGPAEYQDGASGNGTTWNISFSGVLIENASEQLPIGALVEVRFSFFPGSFDTTFVGRVIRHTERGFALEFTDLDDPRRKVLTAALPVEEQR